MLSIIALAKFSYPRYSVISLAIPDVASVSGFTYGLKISKLSSTTMSPRTRFVPDEPPSSYC